MTSLQRNTGALRTSWPTLRDWQVVRRREWDLRPRYCGRHLADWLEAGGELDKQAEAEATEGALDSLLAHGVVEGIIREDATKFKSLTTRWERGWRKKDGEWKMEVRSVDRSFCWSRDRLLGIEKWLGNV